VRLRVESLIRRLMNFDIGDDTCPATGKPCGTLDCGYGCVIQNQTEPANMKGRAEMPSPYRAMYAEQSDRVSEAKRKEGRVGFVK
jgi:hypothetical protein